VITFRYAHLFRDGKKDSTIWGDTGLTGLTTTPVRGIVPTFWDINEDRDIIQADVKHTIAKTDLGLGVRVELVDTDNLRNIHRRPGEPQDRFVTQHDAFETDLFNVHAYTETRFNEKVLFTTGYSFTTL